MGCKPALNAQHFPAVSAALNSPKTAVDYLPVLLYISIN
jgi:hypothetical protein